MTSPATGPFKAKTAQSISAPGRFLMALYDATPGSSGPYCCPQALAAALEGAVEQVCQAAISHGIQDPDAILGVFSVYVQSLRGHPNDSTAQSSSDR